MKRIQLWNRFRSLRLVVGAILILSVIRSITLFAEGDFVIGAKLAYIDIYGKRYFSFNEFRPNYPASKSGLLIDDMIVAINHVDITSTNFDTGDIGCMIRGEDEGPVIFSVLRTNQIVDIPVKRKLTYPEYSPFFGSMIFDSTPPIINRVSTNAWVLGSASWTIHLSDNLGFVLDVSLSVLKKGMEEKYNFKYAPRRSNLFAEKTGTDIPFFKNLGGDNLELRIPHFDKSSLATLTAVDDAGNSNCLIVYGD